MSDIPTDSKRGMIASVKGFANENRVLALLLERGYNASKVDLPHSAYDLIMEYEKDMIRIQVKTVGVKGSISFKGGTRGGKDRTYLSGVKEYIQSPETSDVVVGALSEQINGDKFTFYAIPTLLIPIWKTGSKTINRIPCAKNNLTLIERCKDIDFVLETFGMLSL